MAIHLRYKTDMHKIKHTLFKFGDVSCVDRRRKISGSDQILKSSKDNETCYVVIIYLIKT